MRNKCGVIGCKRQSSAAWKGLDEVQSIEFFLIGGRKTFAGSTPALHTMSLIQNQ